MAEHTKRPPLLPILLALLTASRPAFRQRRTWRRGSALVLGPLLGFGRHTVTQALVRLGLTTSDWSAFYRLLERPRFAYDELSQHLVCQTLADVAATAPYVVALDTTAVPRQSRRIPGRGWLRAPGTAPFARGLRRAQRLLHLAWLVPCTHTGYSRAIPLRFVPAFPEKAVRPAGQVATTEWAAGRASSCWASAMGVMTPKSSGASCPRGSCCLPAAGSAVGRAAMRSRHRIPPTGCRFATAGAASGWSCAAGRSR